VYLSITREQKCFCFATMSWVELKALLRGTLRRRSGQPGSMIFYNDSRRTYSASPLRLAFEVDLDPKSCVKNRPIIFLVISRFSKEVLGFLRLPPCPHMIEISRITLSGCKLRGRNKNQEGERSVRVLGLRTCRGD